MDSESDLERRAAAGDSHAQFALGLRLLDGARAAVDGERGVALIVEAARAGDADACAMDALFSAMGIARQQSWDGALDRLQTAAERGSASARRQLLFLAGDDPDSAEPASAGDSARWTDARRRIDLARLLTPPAKKSLCEAPRMRVMEGFASPAECDWLIARASDRMHRATVFDSATGAMSYEDARSNSATEFQIPDMDLVLEIIRARIAAATRAPVPVFEPMQILHYAPGEQFLPHHDYLDPDNAGFGQQLNTSGQRIATFLIYLNEGFEGGETEFPRINIRYKGGVGDAIFWANLDTQARPDPLTLHAGLAPTSGEKWLLSQWIRDRAGSAGGGR